MKRIGVIRGGDWENYENSLNEGADLISYLNINLADKYTPVDIFIDALGVWHIKGLPILPHDIVHRVDMAWNLAHPAVTQILNDFSIPNVNVPAFSSALKQSRVMLREHMKRSGVNMPQHFIIPAYQHDFDGEIEKYASKKAKEVFEKFGSPWMLKSLTKGNSMGIHVADTYPELVNAIIDGAEHGGSILVEELIAGREVNIHSLSNFRGQDNYIFPQALASSEKEELYKIIQNLHQDTGADYINSHFILNPKRGAYLKDLEFTPDFKEGSDLDIASESVGANMNHVLESILERANY